MQMFGDITNDSNKDDYIKHFHINVWRHNW
jgi:hypothetical protein